MKVRVPLVIEVDPETWAESSGKITDAAGRFTVAAVREDIRSYVLYHVQGAAMIDETGAEVNIKGPSTEDSPQRRDHGTAVR